MLRGVFVGVALRVKGQVTQAYALSVGLELAREAGFQQGLGGSERSRQGLFFWGEISRKATQGPVW